MCIYSVDKIHRIAIPLDLPRTNHISPHVTIATAFFHCCQNLEDLEVSDKVCQEQECVGKGTRRCSFTEGTGEFRIELRDVHVVLVKNGKL